MRYNFAINITMVKRGMIIAMEEFCIDIKDNASGYSS